VLQRSAELARRLYESGAAADDRGGHAGELPKRPLRGYLAQAFTLTRLLHCARVSADIAAYRRKAVLGCWSAASMRTVTSGYNESCISRILICLLVFSWTLEFRAASQPAFGPRAPLRCIVNHDEDGAHIADDGTEEGRHHPRHHPRDYSARVRDAAPGKCKKRASVHGLLVLHKLSHVVADAHRPSACLRPSQAAHLSHRRCEQESDGPSTSGKQADMTNGRGHWDGCPWGFWTLSALSALLAVLDLFYPHQVRGKPIIAAA